MSGSFALDLQSSHSWASNSVMTRLSVGRVEGLRPTEDFMALLRSDTTLSEGPRPSALPTALHTVPYQAGVNMYDLLKDGIDDLACLPKPRNLAQGMPRCSHPAHG